jgi:methylated-DNA-[protein]-cysteine S-methyltransferase
METFYYKLMPSPVGELLLVAGPRGLTNIVYPNDRGSHVPLQQWKEGGSVCHAAAQQLKEYFGGIRNTFDLPLDPHGTPFQQRVWRALLAIPYGETISYGELARRIGRPTSQRAVGAANGQNPLPIVVPCHRVIGSNGSLTGYGGGLPIKQHLLELESAPVAC